MKACTETQTPIGTIYIAEENGAITDVSTRPITDALSYNSLPNAQNKSLTPILEKAVKQLAEYFDAKRKNFDLPLAPKGTAFQQRVWAKLQAIPYGKTITYKQLAENTGCEKGCRAVGGANGKNPIMIVIPCHRVIAAGGKLGGFSGGLENKQFMLNLEQHS